MVRFENKLLTRLEFVEARDSFKRQDNCNYNYNNNNTTNNNNN